MKPEHLPRLDGLRGIAAFGVAFLHLGLVRSVGPDPFVGLPIPEWVEKDAWMLVDLFFVLSGYIFAHCYLQDGKMKKGVTSLSFSVSRFARLWPVSIATLLMSIWLLRADPTTNLSNILLSASFLHILVEPFALNVSAWSISVEVLCYAIFMSAALAGRKYLAIVTLLCIVLGGWLILQNSHVNIGRGLIGFFAGQMLRRNEDKIRVWMVAPMAIIPFIGSGEAWHLLANAMLGWPAIIVLSKRLPVLETKIFTWLGSRSYSIYMIHIPAMYLVRQASPLFGELQAQGVAMLVVAAMVITLWGADILYRAVEAPARQKIIQAYACRQKPRNTRSNCPRQTMRHIHEQGP